MQERDKHVKKLQAEVQQVKENQIQLQETKDSQIEDLRRQVEVSD